MYDGTMVPDAALVQYQDNINILPDQAVQNLNQFVSAIQRLAPDDIKTMIDRRHPDYNVYVDQWKFCHACYKGGREWFAGNIFKYIKEGDTEYAERVARAFRFNHSREVVELVNKYIFKGQIYRKTSSASQAVQQFWNTSTLNRRPIDDFMKIISRESSVYGRIWVCLDTNQTDPSATLLQEKENGSRVYGYTIKPQNMLDLAYDPDGNMLWAKVREYKRDDQNVFSSGDIRTQYRIWTPNTWLLFVEDAEAITTTGKEEIKYVLDSYGTHNLGRVPIFAADHIANEGHFTCPGLIDDIAYMDRQVANYLSNLDAIIQDQTFSQLVMPAQGMLPGDDSQTKILELGTKRMFTFDASGGQAPTYISPDASNATVIVDVINKIVSEIYHSIGMAGERTKQDNSMGIDNSSGVAKAYDFDRMNAMLASKARALEICENTICEMVDTWYGENITPGTYTGDKALVTYPDNFDVRGLYDEIDMAQQLLLIQAPDQVRKQQMLTLIEKLFPNLADADIQKMEAEVMSSWPPEEVIQPPTPPSALVTESQQGQVTKDTATLKT